MSYLSLTPVIGVPQVLFMYGNLQTDINYRHVNPSEISSSHGSEYEAQNLLGCTAMFLTESST
jgi:hypothetical protein